MKKIKIFAFLTLFSTFLTNISSKYQQTDQNIAVSNKKTEYTSLKNQDTDRISDKEISEKRKEIDSKKDKEKEKSKTKYQKLTSWVSSNKGFLIKAGVGVSTVFLTALYYLNNSGSSNSLSTSTSSLLPNNNAKKIEEIRNILAANSLVANMNPNDLNKVIQVLLDDQNLVTKIKMPYFQLNKNLDVSFATVSNSVSTLGCIWEAVAKVIYPDSFVVSQTDNNSQDDEEEDTEKSDSSQDDTDPAAEENYDSKKTAEDFMKAMKQFFEQNKNDESMLGMMQEFLEVMAKDGVTAELAEKLKAGNRKEIEVFINSLNFNSDVAFVIKNSIFEFLNKKTSSEKSDSEDDEEDDNTELVLESSIVLEDIKTVYQVQQAIDDIKAKDIPGFNSSQKELYTHILNTKGALESYEVESRYKKENMSHLGTLDLHLGKDMPTLTMSFEDFEKVIVEARKTMSLLEEKANENERRKKILNSLPAEKKKELLTKFFTEKKDANQIREELKDALEKTYGNLATDPHNLSTELGFEIDRQDFLDVCRVLLPIKKITTILLPQKIYEDMITESDEVFEEDCNFVKQLLDAKKRGTLSLGIHYRDPDLKKSDSYVHPDHFAQAFYWGAKEREARGAEMPAIWETIKKEIVAKK